MTRFILILIAIVVAWWLFRRILRAFFDGLNRGNKNVRESGSERPPELYKDVKDADFKDLDDTNKS